MEDNCKADATQARKRACGSTCTSKKHMQSEPTGRHSTRVCVCIYIYIYIYDTTYGWLHFLCACSSEVPGVSPFPRQGIAQVKIETSNLTRATKSNDYSWEGLAFSQASVYGPPCKACKTFAKMTKTADYSREECQFYNGAIMDVGTPTKAIPYLDLCAMRVKHNGKAWIRTIPQQQLVRLMLQMRAKRNRQFEFDASH